MIKLLVILLGGLIFEAIGVVYLSKGIKEIGEPETVTLKAIGSLIARGLTNPSIWTGVAMELVFFISLLYLMSRGDISFIWPLTSLGFVITAIAAKFVLGETVSPVRWVGVLFIVLGAGIITYSEKMKSPDKAPALREEAKGDSTLPQ
jgi:uncharacterized membrane protein